MHKTFSSDIQKQYDKCIEVEKYFLQKMDEMRDRQKWAVVNGTENEKLLEQKLAQLEHLNEELQA